ncbi:hypothetical protein [Actinoplanes sp. NPDC049316]|uniref:hypothetical protein n=1 Tax=Actinoplanes sp. NPDC049316 TaxID=3154727 RepID=UPI003415055F
MERHVRRSLAAAVVAGTVIGLAGYAPAASADATRAGPAETTRLGDRRFVVTGSRMYEVGAADATYPATGWHIRGEMGGFWTPPIKVLDGIWFGVNGTWLKARRFTTGAGYTTMSLAGPGGLTVQRVDVVPDGGRAALIGLRFPAGAGTVRLTVDAHSELLSAYPWGFTTPGQAAANLPDTGSFDGRNLVFRDRGTPPVANARPHDWAALVGSSLTPAGHALGPGLRGPQAGVICGDPAPAVCDDGPDGRGTGGRLAYDVTAGGSARTVWFAVAGSDQGLAPARAELARALRDPDGALAAKTAARAAVARHSRVDLPGDRLLQQSVEWSKQNLADSVQESRDLHVFASNQGTAHPPPAGVVGRARWIGAGWPDYPWIFATDGEYTAFAAVAAGQFAAVEDHLRTLRDLSEIANDRSGKVVHEVTPDGQVYYGVNADAGNTDETVKFPSAVALTQRERDCFTGDSGLFHTGTGPTSDPAGNPGPSCDSVLSAVPSERSVFSLGNAIMAVAEGNYGRMAQQQRYTTANARSQLDPGMWEMPGAMPEILPSPDFGSNLSKDFLSRSSVLQAWGAYGVLWPVVHQQLGVAPDLGNGRLSVVPLIPAGRRIAGSDIRVGSGHLDVRAASRGKVLSVSVDAAVPARLTLGTVLPDGATVATVTLDGRPVPVRRVPTARGDELTTSTGPGRHTLVVTLKP